MASATAFWDALASLRERHWAFWTLTAANVAGIVFGYYYYWDVGQFDPQSRFYQGPWWWAFVADSPNAVVLMQASLTWWYVSRRRHVLLDSLAFLHMVFVGLWTSLLFLSYPDSLGTFEWGGTNNILFFSHMGMPLEALVLVRDLRRDAVRWPLAAGLAAWGALNLWLDYGPLSLRPAPFVDVDDAFVLGSIALMLFAWAVWAVVAWSHGPRRSRAA